MIKKNWVYILFACSVMLFIYTHFFSKRNIPPSNAVRVDYKLVGLQTGGWGYEIHVNSQPYIKQYSIPAIQFFKPFSSQKDAEQTALLVIKKMKSHLIPAITLQELDSMRIAH